MDFNSDPSYELILSYSLLGPDKSWTPKNGPLIGMCKMHEG